MIKAKNKLLRCLTGRAGRVWTYKSWQGSWLFFGCDEYLRTTLVISPGFGRAVVFALWECKCKGCAQTRVQDPIYRRWMQYRQNTRHL